MGLSNKEAGKILFDQQVPQKEIAKILKVSERTVSEWVVKGSWKEKRAGEMLRKENTEATVWELIEYQTMVLKIKKDRWLAVIEKAGKDVDDKDLKLIERGDIDALQKLFTTVKGKPLEWANIVNIIKEFSAYVAETDIELSKKLMEPASEFMDKKRTDLQ